MGYYVLSVKHLPPKTVTPVGGVSEGRARQLADGTDGSVIPGSMLGAKEGGEAEESKLLDVPGGRGYVYMDPHHAWKTPEGCAQHFYRGWYG